MFWLTLFGQPCRGVAGLLVNKVKECVPGVSVEYHNDNELGLANAGMIEAVTAGVYVVHTAARPMLQERESRLYSN